MNTITLPRGDWAVVEVAIAQFIKDYNLGGTVELILDNISRQLDKQEY